MTATGERAEIVTEGPALLKGYAAVSFAVLVWAGWIVATRDQVGTLSPLDIALARYGTPAILLAPIWLRHGILPKGESPWRLAVMAGGWGGAFVIFTSKGLETIPAALFGPMVPAMLPLIVALWDLAVHRAPVRGERAVGLALIAVSIALIVAPAALRGDAGFFRGAPYLLAAACGWSAFTIAYRGSRLNGLEATAYVCLWSSPFLAAALWWFGTELPTLGWATLGWVVLSQGVLSGIGAVATFGYAVHRLGVARTSSFTSLVPMGAALGGWAFLGEAPEPLDWASVVFACLGVALVNGAFGAATRRR
ncbi:MAG TPA: DMT family transporter [Paracoccaceae bacterium]|nr:DMT family transporter [Paracoccaceae bacterium]